MTLLCDAAHLMPPSGERADLAMLEGAELAQAIVRHPGNVEVALAAFEPQMFERAAAEADEARAMLLGCSGPNAPGSFLDIVTYGGKEVPTGSIGRLSGRRRSRGSQGHG